MSDQPLVANRICDELNFGIKIDYKTFKNEELIDSVREVLDNKAYLENILEFTKLSRQRNGCKRGANIIEKYLNS